MPRIPRKYRTLLVLGLLTLMSARPAAAVIIFLKGQELPLRGYLVRETDDVVVFRQLLESGEERRRTLSKSDIDDLIISVSDERLESLNRSDPQAYREYAEELSEKRKDPDAQQTAIRLFLIAAYLDTDQLGRSCLLGMAGLARDEAERRRFMAMAFLLDPKHDSSLIKSRPTAAPPSSSPAVDVKVADAVVRALRLLRQGQKRDAMTQARRGRLKERLAQVTDKITYEEFAGACDPTCPHCNRGQVNCPECDGNKMVLRGLRRVPCPVCQTRGQMPCPNCGGFYKQHQPSASLVRRILEVEMQYLPVEDRESLTVRRAPERENWTTTIDHGNTAAVRPLTLATISEFDPSLWRYQNGKWTE
jgi:hypothetical protein